MAPSQESAQLATLFKQIGPLFPEKLDDKGVIVARALYDQVATVASEATGVTVEDILAEARGITVPCKKFTPSYVAKKRVVYYIHGGGYK